MAVFTAIDPVPLLMTSTASAPPWTFLVKSTVTSPEPPSLKALMPALPAVAAVTVPERKTPIVPPPVEVVWMASLVLLVTSPPKRVVASTPMLSGPVLVAASMP